MTEPESVRPSAESATEHETIAEPATAGIKVRRRAAEPEAELEPEGPAAETSSAEKPPATPRRRIGPYTVLGELGRGGMGVVYRVEQHEPVRRVVALKIVRALHREQLDARFRTECQTLARLRHPYIAQVFDAGETDPDDETGGGWPYLVMELIDGLPVTAYCDRARLSIRQRLELFIRICEGLQHAHEHGVVHRDVKPSNILVSDQDGRAVPKIIDFGVAKHLDEDMGLTRVGQLVGSPSHMSPEQLGASGRDIDTRTDVYALGNVLYELLTGTVAFLSAGGSVFDYLKQIAEHKLERPSARCRQLGDRLPATAAARRIAPERLGRALESDLDWIVAKALAPRREDRYASASALAADVRHHLDGEPVAAHPGGRGYQLGKLIRRHKVPVMAAAVVAVVLILATVLTSVSWLRTRASEQRAQAAAEQTRTINRFLEDLLSSADPAQAGRDVKVLELIDRKVPTLGRDLQAQPEVEGSLRHTIGRTYAALGAYPEAEEQLRRALVLRAGALGPDHRATLESELAAVELLLRQGELAAGERRAADVVERLARSVGDEDPATLRGRHLLASAHYLRGYYDRAETLQRSTLEIQERVLGRQHGDTLATVLALAKTLNRQGQRAAAAALYRKVHDARVQHLGTDHPDTLESANLLANALYAQGELAEAEALHRDNLERRRAQLGTEHHRTLTSLNNLGIAIYKQGRYRQAEALHREALAIQRRVLGSDHPDTLLSLNNLGNSLRRQGRLEDAEQVYREAMSRQKVVLGPGHDETARTTLNLINVVLQAGRAEEALALAEEGRQAWPDIEDFSDWAARATDQIAQREN